MKKKNFWRNAALFVAFSLLIGVVIAAFNRTLVIRRYEIEAKEITAPVRIALVTDLHSCKYGENQQELIAAVDSLSPDLVLLGGDIYDDEMPHGNTELFLSGIADKYPCYYVSGNHEYWAGAEEWANITDMLVKHGITILSDESMVLTVNKNELNLCGINDPDVSMVQDAAPFSERLEALSSVCANGNYTVLLSHRPEYMQRYASYPYDLVLCGHAHGGQWRIPGILNGLFAPNQGLFPQYAGGKYEENGTTMIVSRGLARESTIVPRVFNRPELVLIELN